MPLSRFHPLIQTWFSRRFQEPTEAQALGWPAIAQGEHTLIAAPTGSGKTLAAFLNCLDSLVRQGLEGELPDATQVVYVSPLKALSNDIHRNLEVPLVEITALAQEMGTPLPEVRAAVRTGDTPMKERQAQAKRPPHILITTPESLYILLTSERGRSGLRSVRTLILDEIHSVVGNKRGSHLSLSVERLCHLAEGPITRIGLSATQRPIEEVARFLVGSQSLVPGEGLNGSVGDQAPGAPHGGPGPARSEGLSALRSPILRSDRTPSESLPKGCTLVDVGHRREMDLAIELPQGHELGPIATHELWAQVLDQIADHVRAHRTTLVFVNTRRLVERVTHQLSERLGEEQVVAHHGSLSRETRFDAEQRLKEGRVKACVATASLELGIDVGDVNLVCQIGSPRAIGVALQRVGRSGHSLMATPKGRVYPLTRDELVEMAALLRAVRQGSLDKLSIPPWPLDILAQQVVAACACEEWEEEALYGLVCRAYPYRELPRERFDQVVGMLSVGVAGRWGRGSAYLHRDGVHGRLKGRRGARISAVTGGGAIPDTGDYSVVAEPEGTFVGTVNEDFAVESMAGDIFLLGNTPWKIRRVEAGTVRVEAAHGQSPTIPFWLGEAPGRTWELSQGVSELRQALAERLDQPEAAAEWAVREAGLDREAAQQVVEYLIEGRRVLGLVPTSRRLVAERFFDEAGGMQLVIHAPLGSRINRAWGLALRKRFCRSFNYELQASATDDGINISLGPQHSFPVEEVFTFLKPATAEQVLLQAVLTSPLFGTRWRWNATRSLALMRQVGGKRVPTPIQRMSSDDLLAAVFPAQTACQDNQPAGMDIEVPDHPLVFETVRDCLTEAMDVEGLKAVLGEVQREEIEVYGRDTVQPSVFSHQILNAMPYAFLDDAPLEERRARAVTLRRALPEDARELGALDPEAIRAEGENAWPPVRDADELHDALLTLGLLTELDVANHAQEPQAWREWFDALVADGRGVRAWLPPSDEEGEAPPLLIATERAPLVMAAYPEARFEPAPPPPDETSEYEEAVLELVRCRVECMGPFTVQEMADALRLREPTVLQAVTRLEGEGLLLRGQFRMPPRISGPAGNSEHLLDNNVAAGAHKRLPGNGIPGPRMQENEYCDRRILARIHRSTIGRLRQEIEPVPGATFVRFLIQWQHATPDRRLSGEEGLLEVIEQLQGFEAAASAWESSILPARVAGYTPDMLDRLCYSGQVTWGRFARRTAGAQPPAGPAALSRNGPISLGLREDLPWLLDHQGEALAGRALHPYTGSRSAEVDNRGQAPAGTMNGNGTGLARGSSAEPALSEGLSALRSPILRSDRTPSESPPEGGRALRGAAAEVLAFLSAHGASFVPDIAAGTRRLPSDVEAALWRLVSAGLVNADGFGPLRGITTGATKRASRKSRFRRRPPVRAHSSRWSLLRAEASPEISESPGRSASPFTVEPWVEERAAQLLRRYGVVVPELLAREPMAPPWRTLLRAYRRAEARGEIRGGRFLAGFVGEQFALPEAVEALRTLRKKEPAGDQVSLSACDPLNVAGILTAGSRVPAVPGGTVTIRDGLVSTESLDAIPA